MFLVSKKQYTGSHFAKKINENMQLIKKDLLVCNI